MLTEQFGEQGRRAARLINAYALIPALGPMGAGRWRGSTSTSSVGSSSTDARRAGTSSCCPTGRCGTGGAGTATRSSRRPCRGPGRTLFPPGCRHRRRRPDPDTIRQLQERGVTLETLPTDQAVRCFGQLDPARVAAALHLTAHPRNWSRRPGGPRNPRRHRSGPQIGQPQPFSGPAAAEAYHQRVWSAVSTCQRRDR
jgi:hypothetical protein